MELVNNNLLVTLTVGQMLELIRFGVKEALQGQEPVSGPEKYYTRREACKKLSISLPTLSSYMKRGIVGYHKIGNRILISEADIKEAVK